MRFVVGVAVVTVVGTLAACGPSKEQMQAEQQKAAQIEAERQKAAQVEAERQKAERQARIKAVAELDAELLKADAKQVATLVSRCRLMILDDERMKSKPFEPFIPDEYSADIHQAAAYVGGGKIDRPDRVKRFLSERKAASERGLPVNYALDLSFTVIRTTDSFSGPQKQVVNRSCDVKPGLKLELR